MQGEERTKGTRRGREEKKENKKNLKRSNLNAIHTIFEMLVQCFIYLLKDT